MFNDFSDTLSLSIAKQILSGFEKHYRNIKKASVEAKRCFEEREWEKIEEDSKRRLNFYDKQVNTFCKKLSTDLNLKKQSQLQNQRKKWRDPRLLHLKALMIQLIFT